MKWSFKQSVKRSQAPIYLLFYVRMLDLCAVWVSFYCCSFTFTFLGSICVNNSTLKTCTIILWYMGSFFMLLVSIATHLPCVDSYCCRAQQDIHHTDYNNIMCVRNDCSTLLPFEWSWNTLIIWSLITSSHNLCSFFVGLDQNSYCMCFWPSVLCRI